MLNALGAHIGMPATRPDPVDQGSPSVRNGHNAGQLFAASESLVRGSGGLVRSGIWSLAGVNEVLGNLS
jgi:hypothetical protein